MFKNMSYKTRVLGMVIIAVFFFLISPSENELKEIEKTKMEQLSEDVIKINVLEVIDNFEAYEKLHKYYKENDEYKNKYEKYKQLKIFSSYCLSQSIEINKKFLKNTNSYDNEKYKYSKWINEQSYIVAWEFTGKNAFNVEYKFNSEYECKIKADGSSTIKQNFMNQI